MIRTLILSVLLAAITVTAALIGLQRQSVAVETPVEGVPIEPGGASAPEQAPRFLYDAPLAEQPQGHVRAAEPAASAAAERPASRAAESSVSAPPEHAAAESAQPAPPASSAQPAPEAAPQAPAAPTEEEIAQAAAIHLRELGALEERIAADSDALTQRILVESAALPDAGDPLQLGALIDRWMPQVDALARAADADAEQIFANLTASLEAIGAPLTAVAEARLSYETAKQTQLGYYEQLAAAYRRSVTAVQPQEKPIPHASETV